MTRGLLALLALALAASTAGSAYAGPGMFVGFSDDRPKWEGTRATAPAADLGARALRVVVRWDGAQTVPTATQIAELDNALGAAGGFRMLFVFAGAAAAAPQTSEARDAYCAFAANVLTRYPSVNDAVLWGEPNKSAFWQPQFNADGTSAAPAAYAALAARCWDVLHAVRGSMNVIGPALAPNGNDLPNAASNVSHSPGNFIRKLGEAYRASGRSLPILDTFAHHAYGAMPGERPWRQHIGSKIIAQGDWNKLMYNLWQAFDGTAQAIPGQCNAHGCPSLWYTEAGYETQPDDAKAALYTGTELQSGVLADFVGGEPSSPAPDAASVAPDQHTQVLDGVRLAYCQPYVGAFFNFLLWDEARREGWQSGAYWADLTPKDSLPAFRQAFAEVNSGAVACASLKGGTPSADYFPPSAPAGVAGEVQRDPLRVVLTWQPAADNVGATTYRVYRNGVQIATASTTTWTDSTVADASTYSYTVRALDAAGNMGDASAAATVTTPDLTAPSVPTNLVATASAPTRVDLTWSASTDKTGVSGYHVYRNGVYLATTATASYADAAVFGSTTYTYAVSAFDAAGNTSQASPTVTVTTPGPAPEVTRTYAPSSYSILAGSIQSNTGAVSRLASDDSVRLELGGTKSGKTYVADFYASTTVAEGAEAVKKLVLTYDGHASSGGVSVSLLVFNWQTNAWETIDGPRLATTSDRTITWTAANPAAVVSATREVRVRIRATQGRLRWFVGHTDLIGVAVTS